MSCIYKYKDRTFGNIKDLANDFYLKTNRLSGKSNIYSREDIINSSKQLFDNFIDNNEVDSSFMPINAFITGEHQTMFKKLDINKDRLAPEYIEENRKLNYILENLPTKYSSAKNIKDLESMLSTEDLDSFNSSKSNIDDILNSEKVSNKISGDIKKALVDCILNNNPNYIQSRVNDIISKHKDSLDGGNWDSKLVNIITEISTKIRSNTEAVYGNLPIKTDGLDANLNGYIDIATVDSDGNKHIYAVKVSKGIYDDWDQSKKLTTDWQMAFQRGILGQYDDMSNTSLNIISLGIGSSTNGKMNSNNIKYDSIVNLMSDDTKGLRKGGMLTEIVNKIIPQATKVLIDPERESDFLADLNILIPGYEIKTSSAQYDVDKMVQNAIDHKNFTLRNFFSNSDDLTSKMEKVGYELQSNGLFTHDFKAGENQEETFRKAAEVFSEYGLEHKNNNLVSLRNAVETAITSGESIKWNNDKTRTTLNNLFMGYINGGYRVINDIPELDDLGLILLQNKSDNKYTFLSISSSNPLARYDNNLIHGELEYMKVFLFMNKFKDELNLGSNKIQSIKVYNLSNDAMFSRSYDSMFDKFQDRMKSKGIDLNITKSISTPNIIDVAEDSIRDVLRNYSGDNKTEVDKIFEPFTDPYKEFSYQELVQIQKDMRRKFPQLQQETLSSISFGNNIEYLYGCLSSLILYKASMIPEDDYFNLKNYAVGFNNFKTILNPLFTDKEYDYDKEGNRNIDPMGGLMTVVPDKVPSQDLLNINNIISSANTFVREMTYKESTDIAFATRKYYKAIGYTPTEQNWIANYRGKYENLWVTDNTGKISSDWITKNPYEQNLKNNLSDPERQYLKEMLFEINKYKLGIEDADDVDIENLDTLGSSNNGRKILNAINDGSYFEMPLIRNQQVSRVSSVWIGGFKGMIDRFKNTANEMSDFFNNQELAPEDRAKLEKEQMGYYESYDVYRHQTPSWKKSQINTNGDKYYEINLDILAHRYVFNKIRKNIMDNVIPLINDYMWNMKMRAGIANEDISNQLDYITKRLKVAIYDTTIINKELQDPAKLIHLFKRATSFGTLALRPALLVKEAIVGTYRNVEMALTKPFGDQIDMKSYKDAYQEMFSLDNKFSTKWNLWDALNNTYGIANLDVNQADKKFQTDRRGIMMGLSPWLYANTTLMDYPNRMSLFVAKMMKDGSYKAYSVDEKGYLKYDPEKDERFSTYFKERDKYKNKNGEYIAASGNEEFNRQRNLYLLLLGERNKERKSVGLREFTEEGDKLDLGYSSKEALGFKTITDTMYGYYDKDTTSLAHHTFLGMVFLQFLQFMPGKTKLWFGKTINGDKSQVGSHVQKVRIDDDGNEHKIWRKIIYTDDSKTKIDRIEETEQYTGDPALEWKGSPQEGVFVSLLKTIRYLATGDMGKFKSDELVKNRAMFALADCPLMIGIFMISKYLWMSLLGGNSDKSSGSYQTEVFMKQVNDKVLGEADIWSNTFGAINATPAFVTYTQRSLTNMNDVLNGTSPIQKMDRTVKALEMFDLSNAKTGLESSQNNNQ